MDRPARWLIPEIDRDRAGRLAASLGISPVAARVLAVRGYDDPDAARRFLNPSLDDLHDPYLMLGMSAAVERLRSAIGKREKILLYGDYDADGTISVVILKKAIELAGGAAEHHIPNRLRDGYGVHPEVIEAAAAAGTKLIVSVDTGIRAAEAVCRARSLGIDVIVTDHHLPDRNIPPALAVLNPNQPGCGYPDKNLCGAGVAFKLVQALLATLDWPAVKLRRITESFLKLVAIGTVADVVPLTGENRIIVKKGLEGLQSVRNPGLSALLSVAGFEPGSMPSAGQVAFRIAPRMNAAGRMADANDIVSLLLTDDHARARELAERLHSLNRERQETESAIVREILHECLAQPVTDEQAALVFCGRGWHRGVVGIVASRIVEKFHRPAFVLGEDPEQGIAQGSGRSIPNFHLLEALESMPELFLRYGGHRQAAGLSLAADRVDEFRRRLNVYAAARLTPEDFRPEIEVDSLLRLDEISERAVEDVLAMAPFGCGNPAPVFAVLDAEIAAPPCVMKEKHLRLVLRQNSHSLVLKAWNFAGRAGELQPGARVDAALMFDKDDYSASRGFPGWCAMLRDVRAAGAV
ncbi:MAG: single-stranded-DNA-specific exonuclease RecJ [Rhodospirillales bacterium]